MYQFNFRINNAFDRIWNEKEKDKIHPSTDPEVDPESATEKVGNVNKIFETFDKKMDQVESYINEKVIKRIEMLEDHEDNFTTK